MEAFLTEGNVKDYWLEHIIFDKDFFGELYKRYRLDLVKLGQKLINNSSINIPQLSVPNELIDFLDGNGFVIENVEQMFIITEME